MKKVVFILGPTAVGKSALGVWLAKKFDGEIISADSVQIFRGLNIGSAKITQEEMQGVCHHGIDICDPTEEFSTFDFVQFTKNKIEEICVREHLPIVVGGTGLYVKALVRGFNLGGVEKNETLREELKNLAAREGLEALVDRLQKKDAKAADKIDKKNKVRLIRAIEIAESAGQKDKEKVEFSSLVLGLVRPRELLYESINMRVDKMMQDGLLQEVSNLKKAGLNETYQSMHAIGYKEMLTFLSGDCSLENAVELVKQHSRNYAKRQMTFLRSMEEVKFVDTQNIQSAEKQIMDLVQNFLKS